MSLLKKLGPDTISRLEKAAALRHEEASYLADGGYHLSSIYLAGYAAEMTIGSAYFRTILGYGLNRTIDQDSLQKLLKAARQLSEATDKSHPIDGLAHLLIRDKEALNPPAFDGKTGHSLQRRVGQVCEHWGPKLRYRAIEATSDQSNTVLSAVRWIIDHCPKH